jgi:hypothetical protein
MKTAVEWLVEQIFNDVDLKDSILKLAINQAKEMEKEQIIDAYDAGLFDGTMDDVNDRMHKKYYNETFKSE